MTKYILLTLGSFGYFTYKFLALQTLGRQIIPRPEYYNFTAPLLLSISAGLFISNRFKSASVYGLIGLSIASKDVLSNWLVIDLIDSRYWLQLFTFASLTTIYLFFLGFITVTTLLSNDNIDRFEIIKYKPNGMTTTIYSAIPVVIIGIATITLLMITLVK